MALIACNVVDGLLTKTGIDCNELNNLLNLC